MSSKFIHLHVHSHYSLLDGMAKIGELIEKSKEYDMSAVALTDHGVMYGTIEFYTKAKDAGIKPIIGVEAYVTKDHREKSNHREDRHHLVLLAKNEEGYRNLLKITSLAHLEGFYYKPRVDKNIIRRYSKGLIALSACIAGEVPSAVAAGNMDKARDVIKEYQGIFGKENFFLELQTHNSELVNNGLKDLSSVTGAQLVATNDVHYVRNTDNEVQDILLCVQLGRKVDDKDRMSLMDFDLHFKEPQEMINSFLDVPEAIENTLKIADMCDVKIKLGESLLPAFTTPSGEKSEDYLYKLCLGGVENRFNDKLQNLDPKIKERLDYELEVINRMGFASYFLIVQDFVNWSKQNGIVVGPGRGSAAGSLIAYVLGITDLNPLEYGLLFERFLNPDRISMPDIDVDFADDRRDEVIEYVSHKYGKDRVAQIITFGTMAARASIRDVGRVLGYPYDFCDRIAKMIPMGSSFNDALEIAKDLKEAHERDPAVTRLIKYARRLEGVARHSSMHACGVVIGPDRLDNFTPLQYASTEDQTVITQYEGKSIEKAGLLKMDFLGLKNLTLLQHTVNIIQRRHNIEIVLNKIPFDDEEAFTLFQRGETTGFFQFESSGMRRYLKKLHPTSFEDLIAMAALYRPGPLNSGMVDEFIARKHGEKRVTYSHPSMEAALKNTYGVIVYQEQVMQLSKDMAGFTGGEADTLRKGMGKKIAELIAKLREDFIAGCIKNGIDKSIAVQTFDDMEKFAEYGFNRSHAACYALIGYQTAYLKGHYPAEFMAALLTADQNNTDRIAIEVEECRQLGIPVLPPSVNKSYSGFTVVDEDGKRLIRFGLNAIKNVGEHIVKVIVKERKERGEYKNISDFLRRVQDKDLNKKSLESLIKAGAMDSLGERGQFLENLEKMLQFHKQQMKDVDRMQSGLFGFEQNDIVLPAADPIPEADRLNWERELLGLFVSGHPLNDHKELLGKYTTSISSLTMGDDGNGVRVGGVVGVMKKIFTRNNDAMIFAEIEDLNGKLEIIVFPKVLEANGSIWQSGNKVIIEGRISTKDDSLKVLAENVFEISDFTSRAKVGEVSPQLPESLQKRRRSYKKNENNFNNNYRKNSQESSSNASNGEKINENNIPKIPEFSYSQVLVSKGSILLKLDKTHNVPVIIPRLNLVLTDSVKGETEVFLEVDYGSEKKKLKTAFLVSFTNALLKQLEEILGKGKVEWS